jgi:hypothetical protein
MYPRGVRSIQKEAGANGRREPALAVANGQIHMLSKVAHS